MSDKSPPANDPAFHLASILQALKDCEKERAQYIAEWKERVTRLRKQEDDLTLDILTGQKRMFDSPPTGEAADRGADSIPVESPPTIPAKPRSKKIKVIPPQKRAHRPHV